MSEVKRHMGFLHPTHAAGLTAWCASEDVDVLEAERNLIVACLKCNSSKGARPLIEWLRSLPRSRARIVERLCIRRGISQSRLPLVIGHEKFSTTRHARVTTGPSPSGWYAGKRGDRKSVV